jgi:carbonic anhydrase/acetyltransferase-like protein (isoleucine patch superfamily)
MEKCLEYTKGVPLHMPLIKPFRGAFPMFAGAYIAENATLIGAVQLDTDCSIWYGAILRADVQPIQIGKRTNIQDGAMIHASTGRTATTIGDDVTVGHGAILHGCTLESEILIGMGAVVLDDAHVPRHTIVAAKAVVLEGAHLESGWLYAGIPAKKIKPLTAAQYAMLPISAKHYVEMAQAHFLNAHMLG